MNGAHLSDSATSATYEARKAERLAYVPPKYQKLFLRSLEGSLSPRQAIKAKCLECMGYMAAEIPKCTAPLCPLWAYRPYQSDTETPE